MIVLSDNDLILKLAQCDLLGHLDGLLGAEHSQIYVTASAPFQLRKRTREKGVASCGNEASYNRLLAFLARTATLPEVEDLALLAKLATISGIDPGEQQLFAAMKELERPLLLTDDMRSLAALLSNSDVLQDLIPSVSGRVVTFASSLLIALAHLGFPAVKQKLLGNPKPDGMLRLVLREDMTRDSLVECLASYARPAATFLAFSDQLRDAGVVR